MSSKVAILIAIVIGIIAALFIHSYMNKQKIDESGTYRPVMQVSKNIPVGGILTVNNVKEVMIPDYAYSKNMQVTPKMFEQYRGRPVRNVCYKGEFLTMADLAGTVDKDKPVDVESGYAELTVDLPPGKHYDFQKGSTVVLMMQDMVRRTSAHDVEMRNSYQYTLLTNLTVLDVGTSIGDGTIARPSVTLRIKSEYRAPVATVLNQCKNITVFAYNPNDPLFNTDKGIIEFYTEHGTVKEVYEKLKEALRVAETEE